MSDANNKAVRGGRNAALIKGRKAIEILENDVFLEAQHLAENEVIKAMMNLRVEELPYQEAAGIALTLVNKLQATRSQNRVLNRLVKTARMDPSAQE